jgi:hypothetical protein
MIRAYCFASGLIEFGVGIPDGALPIARGPEKELRDLIDAVARHGYDVQRVNGRLRRRPGTDCLLVPGIPEAPNQSAALDALKRFTRWAAQRAPKTIIFTHSSHRLSRRKNRI